MFDTKVISEKPRVRVAAVIDQPTPEPKPDALDILFVDPAQARGIRAQHLGTREPCGHCAATGKHHDNGLCFQCQGKGWQSDRDRAFNARYQARRRA